MPLPDRDLPNLGDAVGHLAHAPALREDDLQADVRRRGSRRRGEHDETAREQEPHAGNVTVRANPYAPLMAETELCWRCRTPMAFVHGTWQCPNCKLKLGCCEGEPQTACDAQEPLADAHRGHGDLRRGLPLR